MPNLPFELPMHRSSISAKIRKPLVSSGSQERSSCCLVIYDGDELRKICSAEALAAVVPRSVNLPEKVLYRNSKYNETSDNHAIKMNDRTDDIISG